MLFRDEEIAALEALLFLADEPLNLEKLAEIIQLTPTEITELMLELKERYATAASGLTIIEVNGGFKLGTKPAMSKYVEALYKQPQQALSNAALEVLAIIAYKQPITRGEVDFLRGVQSDKALATLLEKGLIQEVGRKDGPGRPILYGTTEQFLLHFGLKSLEDLPQLDLEKLPEEAL